MTAGSHLGKDLRWDLSQKVSHACSTVASRGICGPKLA
jgi:hypothetical protein